MKELNESISKKARNISALSNLVDSTLSIQKEIFSELSKNVQEMWGITYEQYELISKLSDESLSKSNEVYEKSLDFFVEINFEEISVNLLEIDRMVENLSEEDRRTLKNFDDHLNRNEKLFESYLKHVDFGEKLIDR